MHCELFNGGDEVNYCCHFAYYTIQSKHWNYHQFNAKSYWQNERKLEFSLLFLGCITIKRQTKALWSHYVFTNLLNWRHFFLIFREWQKMNRIFVEKNRKTNEHTHTHTQLTNGTLKWVENCQVPYTIFRWNWQEKQTRALLYCFANKEGKI